jgi:hypothetical protein
MESRSALPVDARVTIATGTAERETALAMPSDRPACGRITVGADKLYDARSFVTAARALGVIPHVAQNTTGRRSNIDGRTTRHRGYEASLRIRKRFGWMKAVGMMRKTRHRGMARVGWQFTAAAYNLLRIPVLLAS